MIEYQGKFNAAVENIRNNQKRDDYILYFSWEKCKYINKIQKLKDRKRELA